MKKLIAASAAAGLLVAGAFVASTVTPSPADAQARDTVTERPARPTPGAIVNDVIDGLVVDGTIDSDQAAAIKDAFETRRDEIVEKYGPFPRDRRDAQRGVLRGLMADGVITQAEVDALPEDHPLRTGRSPLSALLEDDGQITQAELQAFREANRPQAPGQDASGG